MKNKETLINNSLKSLLEKFSNTSVIPTIEENYARESVKFIKLSQIEDNMFIRKAKISEANLKEYISMVKENGLIRPLVIRPLQNTNQYEIVIGRRIFIACKKLNITEIPAIIQNFTDEQTLLILLADTLEQRSYNIIEVAFLMKYLKKNFHYQNKTLATLIKKSPSQVSNILQLLNLPKEILRDIVNNKLSYGHAKAISRLQNEAAIEIVNEIYSKDLTVRETERLVQVREKRGEFNRVIVKNNKISITLDSNEEAKELSKKIKQLLNQTK